MDTKHIEDFITFKLYQYKEIALRMVMSQQKVKRAKTEVEVLFHENEAKRYNEIRNDIKSRINGILELAKLYGYKVNIQKNGTGFRCTVCNTGNENSASIIETMAIYQKKVADNLESGLSSKTIEIYQSTILDSFLPTPL